MISNKIVLIQMFNKMLRISFNKFFLEPLQSIISVIGDYSKFLFRQLKEGLLLKNFVIHNKEQLLNDGVKFFRFFLFVVLANIALNSVVHNSESNFIKDIVFEILITIVYFLIFIITYYYSVFLGKILKMEGLESYSLKLWNFYALILFLLLQVSGSLNTKIDASVISVRGVDITLNSVLLIAVHLIIVYLIKKHKKEFVKKHLLFLFLFYPLLAVSSVLFAIILMMSAI